MFEVRGERDRIDWGFFFQAEDGILGLVRSRGLGDVYKRQHSPRLDPEQNTEIAAAERQRKELDIISPANNATYCLLYTSDAADDLLCVDLGGRSIIKKKTTLH